MGDRGEGRREKDAEGMQRGERREERGKRTGRDGEGIGEREGGD